VKRLGVTFALTLGLTLTTVGGTTAGVESQSSPAASRIIDRTLVCTPFALYGGVRDLDVVASPRGDKLLRGTVYAISVGYIGVSSGPDASGSDLVIARSHTQERYQQQPQAPGVYVNARRCSRVRTMVPLSPRGLPGPPVRFSTEGKCSLRGRVLVRLRAALQSPTSWLPAAPPYVGARREVVEATVAVRRESTRRPIALIQLGRSGTTKLWTAPACS
jgi:hypothetical protein